MSFTSWLGLTTFDRYVIRRFLAAYLVCFVSLVALYVVIDAFNNFDEFSEISDSLGELFRYMSIYYGTRSVLFFDRLAGVINLLAVIFVFGWIRRQNELIPFLSAGIPTWRVILGGLITTVAVNGLVLVNQEVVIPAIGDRLLRSPDDPHGEKTVSAEGAYDSNGILIAGQRVDRKNATLRRVTVVLPRSVAGRLITIHAAKAVYQAPGREGELGRWILYDAEPRDLNLRFAALRPGDQPGTYVLLSDVSLQDVYRGERWYHLEPTRRLLKRLQNPRTIHRSEIAVLVHSRLTRPLLNTVIVFLALPLVLGGADRKLFWSLGSSILLSAVVHGVVYVAHGLGNHEVIDPALAAWLPVLVFGPAAAAVYDLVQT